MNRKTSLISFNGITKILIKESKYYELDRVSLSESSALNKEVITRRDHAHISALKFYQIVKKKQRVNNK